MELYQKALTGLKTGGMTLEASLQEIEQGKKEAIAGGQQALVSGGLSGTTMAAGVPIQAEKIASRQRLGARGQAERAYLTTLASFAAFSQRGVEAQKQRAFEARQAELGRVAATGTTRYGKTPSAPQPSLSQFMSEFDVRNRGGGGDTTQAQQFPSLYDQGGEMGAYPGLVDGGGGGVAGTPAGAFTAGVGDAGVGGGGGYEIDSGFYGGGYTPQTGDYMSVAGGAGGPILGGGGTTSYGEATQSYSPGDIYVGGSTKGGVTTYYYRTGTGKIVPGPTPEKYKK